MNLRVLMVAIVFAVLFLITGILHAGNGDLIVNGNLGVGTGTTAPTEKAEIKGNMKVDGTITSGGHTVNGNLCVGGNCTNSLHVSGGLYGYCFRSSYVSCGGQKSPAFCNGSTCACPAGYAIVVTGVGTNASYYACYKD